MGDFNINFLNVATHQKTYDFIDNVIAQGFIPYEYEYEYEYEYIYFR